MPKRYGSMLERLYANALETLPSPYPETIPAPCRLWTGAVDSSGYGKLAVRSRYRDEKTGHRKTKTIGAHRAACAETLGVKIWQLNHVTHICDRKRCIEGTHLFSTTHRRNMRDMVRKGRHGNAYRAPINA